MKKFSVVMIALIFLCLGGRTALGVEWELGHESNFLLTDLMELQLRLGMFGEEGVRVPQGFGEAQFSYWGESSLSALRFYLNGGQYGADHTRIYGAYLYPALKDLDLQVGLRWERNHGVQEKIASLQGNWRTAIGVVQLGVKGGTRDGAFLEYEGRAKLMDWLSLETGTGVRFDLVDHTQKWTIPVELALNFDLAKNWGLRFTADDAFPLNNLPDEEPLKLGLVLQTTFDLRGKKVQPEASVEAPEVLEETQSSAETIIVEGTDTTTQPEPVEEPITTEPVAVEEIPVVVLPGTNTTAATEQPADEVTSEATTEETAVTTETVEQTEPTPNEQTDPVDEAEIVELPPVNSYDPVTGLLQFNGKQVTVGAVMEGDQAYIPIRYTVQLLGGQVYWYGEPRQICIVLHDVKVLMLTRQSMYMRNGETFPINDGLELWSGHYYILADRFIELIGVK